MRKFFSLSFVIVFFGILFTTNLGAVCPTPPPDDYPGIPFVGPIQVTFTTPGGCKITYTYCYRTTPVRKEFYIDVLWIGDGTGGILNPSLSNICQEFYVNSIPYGPHIAELVNVCAENLIYMKNPWGDMLDIPQCCPPSSDPCWTPATYRMGTAKCWGSLLMDPVEGRLYITHCDSPGVCWSAVRICWRREPDAQGVLHNKLHFDKSDYTDDGTQCTSSSGGSCGTSCGE